MILYKTYIGIYNVTIDPGQTIFSMAWGDRAGVICTDVVVFNGGVPTKYSDDYLVSAGTRTQFRNLVGYLGYPETINNYNKEFVGDGTPCIKTATADPAMLVTACAENRLFMLAYCIMRNEVYLRGHYHDFGYDYHDNPDLDLHIKSATVMPPTLPTGSVADGAEVIYPYQFKN